MTKEERAYEILRNLCNFRQAVLADEIPNDAALIIAKGYWEEAEQLYNTENLCK